MHLTKFALFVLFSACISLCFADALIYETYFQEQPEDWYATTFQFGPYGAVIDINGHISFDANLCTGNTIPLTCNIFIPDGADSIQVNISQSLQVSGGEYPNMEFSIYLETVNQGYELVWAVDVDYQNPSYYQSGTLSFTPDWIQQGGDYLGFYFRADVIPDEWDSSVYWAIDHITVYAYGDDLSFGNDTWGAIKETLGE